MGSLAVAPSMTATAVTGPDNSVSFATMVVPGTSAVIDLSGLTVSRYCRAIAVVASKTSEIRAYQNYVDSKFAGVNVTELAVYPCGTDSQDVNALVRAQQANYLVNQWTPEVVAGFSLAV